MHYLIISFSYKNSSLDIREKLDLSSDERHTYCMQKLTGHDTINEVIIENTCNRIEILANVRDVPSATEHIFLQLHQRSEISLEELHGRADIYTDEGAIHHLFSVASSLDSLVIGETQIVGQLKDAYRFSLKEGFCGKQLSRAMDYAFRCASQVRQETHISSKPVSIASVAVAKAKEQVHDLKDVKALVIGSGEMSRLACKHLVNHGSQVTLINRTQSKAEAIALEIGEGVEVRPYSELAMLINENRLLFTATSASEAIITKDMVHAQSSKRYWFDLAVPRDVEFDIPGVEVSVVDDLEDIAKSNMEFRQEEAKNSYAIVGKYTQDFFNWLQGMNVEPLIKSIYLSGYKAVSDETQRAIKKGYLPSEYEASAQKMAEQAMKRMLHGMSKRVRSIAHTPEVDTVLESLQFLLGVEDSEVNKPATNNYHIEEQ
ncbi:MAG: glutamyl-tRNA reductase [Thiovulaceae bacterium]|nr:glutamyl-tRNA reductase [Sulfurimonadaceae bacterium]